MERRVPLAENLSIDMELLNTAVKFGGLKTKKDTVNLALQEFIKRRRTVEILTLFEKTECDADYDYKDARRRNR
jgi:Arc/MetJ family transcription regulator